MNDSRRTAFLTGILFLITYATSIPALLLYGPLVEAPGALLTPGAERGVLIAAFLELALIAANIGTAIVLFPVLKGHSEALALGFVTARLIESFFIAVGILSVLSVVVLQHNAAMLDAASVATVSQAFVTLHQWTFLLGPGFTVGIGNGLVLGYLMYRTRLVPRWMSAFGLVGGPLLLISGTAILFGLIAQGGLEQMLSTGPEFIWELVLGLWLTFKGFTATAAVEAPATAGFTNSAAAAH